MASDMPLNEALFLVSDWDSFLFSSSDTVEGLDGGCMPDWTYSELGMVSYTVELSEGDFVLPPSYIRPTGLEVAFSLSFDFGCSRISSPCLAGTHRDNHPC